MSPLKPGDFDNEENKKHCLTSPQKLVFVVNIIDSLIIIGTLGSTIKPWVAMGVQPIEYKIKA